MSFFRSAPLQRLLLKAGAVNWSLLLAMIALTQNRFFALKPLAVGGAALYFGIRRHYPGMLRLHPFYFAMAGLCLVQLAFVVPDFTPSSITVTAYGVGLWVLMGVAFLFMRAATQQATEKSVVTLEAYFGVVVLLTLVNLAGVIAATGVLNPYENAPVPLFGVSSGDHLSGLYGFHLWKPQLGDYSGTNSTVAALFTLWFFMRRQWKKAFLALAILLLTISNFVNLMLFAALGLYTLFSRRKVYYGALAGALLTTIVFYAVVTPGNFSYGFSQLKNKPSQNRESKTIEPTIETKQKPQVVATAPFNPDQRRGKAESFLQTGHFLTSSASHAIWGAGAGRFSSMLAQLSASEQGAAKGRFFAPLHYKSPLYKANHGAIDSTIKSLPPQYHSVSQTPASWYNQLLGEYGFVGLLLFAFFYLKPVLRSSAKSRALLFLLLLLLFADYFFEALCLLPLFEWLLLTQQAAGEKTLPSAE